MTEERRPDLLHGIQSVLVVVAHLSQADDNTVLYRRLELLGDTEHLRSLRAPRRPSQGHPDHSTRSPQ